MNRVFLAGYLVTAMLLSGCQQKTNTIERVLSRDEAVNVIIEGADSFPEFLVGHWKDNESGWEFVFEEDGYISSAVLSFGQFYVEPGVISTVPMKNEKTSVLEPGPWLVRYSAQDNELLLEINMQSVHVEMGPSLIEGHSKDVLVGTLYPQLDQWQADWFAYPQYLATTNVYKNHPLYTDPNSVVPQHLVFSRVKEEGSD